MISTINLFQQLKIFQVDVYDNHLEAAATSDGILEICQNDSTNQVNLILYSFDEINQIDHSGDNNNNNKVIYLDLNLKDLDFSFLKINNSKSLLNNNRIELRKNLLKCSFFHAIEFPTDDSIQEFKNNLTYLKEIYAIDTQVKDKNNNHNEKLDRPINSSQQSEDHEMTDSSVISIDNDDDLNDTVESKKEPKRFKKDQEETHDQTNENNDKQNSHHKTFNELDELCNKLKISIKNGDLVGSALYAKELALKHSDLTIIPNNKPQHSLGKQEDLKKDLEQNYSELAAFYNQEVNENFKPFDCDKCFEKNVRPKNGVILKECIHVFCKKCLRNHINNAVDLEVKCPYSKYYNCQFNLQDREIRALLSDEEYTKYQMKGLRKSEATMQNTVHCKTPDCIGFCISEDNLNFFYCTVCEKVNCLKCNGIHMGKTCKEYQDDLKIQAVNDKNAQKDKEALEKLIAQKKVIYCPGCKIILCNKEESDWLQCAMCKTEICCTTKDTKSDSKQQSESKQQQHQTNNDYNKEQSSPMSSESSPTESITNKSTMDPTKIKLMQNKCHDLTEELKKINFEIDNFVGKKADKSYLKLEELLTRCLLKLDEIERGDDQINQTRKSLINHTHKLSDKLEAKATTYNK